MITMVELQVSPMITAENNYSSDVLKTFQNSSLQRSIETLSALKMTSNDANSFSRKYKSYQCIKCNKTFNEKNIYQIHLCKLKINCDDLHHCNICGKSFSVPARLIRHYRTHTGEKPYQCEYCNKSFSVKENLSVHRRIHTKERPYKCDICKSAFEHSGKLHRHMRIHTGERPHKCSLCNKTFIQSGQLVIHMRTHTGEKPYICKSCGKGFTCSKQLKVHTRTHTGEKPYKCDICGKSFGYNHVLKLHQVSHYGEKFYKCTVCQETFNSKRFMELHIKSHAESSINFNNSPKLNTTVYERTNINKMFSRENRILMIENKTEKILQKSMKKFENSKIHKVNDYSNIVLYNNLYEQNNPIDRRVPSLLDDQPYLTMNPNSFISKHSNIISTQVNHIQDTEMQNQTPTHRKCITTYNPLNSCMFKIKEDTYFSEESLSRFCSSNNKMKESLEPNLPLIEELETETNTELNYHESYSTVHNNSVNVKLNTNSLSMMMSKVNDNLSLPPRKRCKKILEFMETEKSDLRVTKRFNSVIKFAKLNSNLTDK